MFCLTMRALPVYLVCHGLCYNSELNTEIAPEESVDDDGLSSVVAVLINPRNELYFEVPSEEEIDDSVDDLSELS